jgi:hypothetical protein
VLALMLRRSVKKYIAQPQAKFFMTQYGDASDPSRVRSRLGDERPYAS